MDLVVAVVIHGTVRDRGPHDRGHSLSRACFGRGRKWRQLHTYLHMYDMYAFHCFQRAGNRKHNVRSEIQRYEEGRKEVGTANRP